MFGPISCMSRQADDAAVAKTGRTGELIIQRYKKIRKACLEFEGTLKQIKALKPTGDPTNADLERAATAVLNGKAQPADMYQFFNCGGEPGKAFPYMRPLVYLRGTNLWKTINQSTAKTRDGKPSSETALGSPSESLTQPRRLGESPSGTGSLPVAETVAQESGRTTPEALRGSRLEKPLQSGSERPIGTKRAKHLATATSSC